MPTLASVDRWYRCARCEYIARSTPLVSIYDEDGNEIGAVWDRCPICGDSYWIWCGGEGRDQREATLLREAGGE